MTDIKTIHMSVPLSTVKAGRKTKKQKEISHDVPSLNINKQLGNKESLILRQKAGDPMPILSTTRAVGGNSIQEAKPVLKVSLVNSKVEPPQNNISNNPVAIKSVIKPVKIIPLKKPVFITRKASEPVKVNIQPKNRPNKTLKKYTAKKIIITMEPTSKMRKIHNNISIKVANMPLEEITKKLIDGGLLRATSNPPESIQRSMMKDLLLFPTPI